MKLKQKNVFHEIMIHSFNKRKLLEFLRKIFPDVHLNSNSIVIQRIPSKKNIVVSLTFLEQQDNLPRELIIKIFKSPIANKEFKILNLLFQNGINVPRVLKYDDPYLIMEKINGINVCDALNIPLINKKSLDDLDNDVKENLYRIINKLAIWLNDFHSKNMPDKTSEKEHDLVLDKGDTRLRDFIYQEKNDVIFGVDFEDSYYGNHIDDLAWICCSMLDTTPGIFELEVPLHKMELINYFLKQYYNKSKNFSFDFQYFAEKLIENLNLVMKRRQINLILNKNTILRNILKDI